MNPQPDPFLARLPESVRGPVAEALKEPTWIRVRRALSAFDKCPPADQGPEVGVQILASFEVESIAAAFRLGLHCIPARPKLRVAPLNTIEQELLDRQSPVYAEPALATVVLWRAEELLADHFYPASAAALGPVTDLTARISKMVESFLESGAGSLFLGTLPQPAALGGAPQGSRTRPALAHAISALNAALFEMSSRSSRVHVIDVNWWAAQEGWTRHDQQMDFLAKQPFTIRAAVSLGFFIARNLRPLVVPRRKVLVVDLDNTLWGGILGEDGIANLKLGHDFPGSVYLQIQREIRELKAQGVLLVLASKNDEPLARQAFETLPNMILRWDDFVCRKINFEPKYMNLRSAAAELGLGLDSFAFLDDSDFEREQMKAFNPEILVLNDRDHALHLLSGILTTDAFDTHRVTEEDRLRHRDYELRSARSVPAEGNLAQFLSSLELRAVLEPVKGANLDRAVQMLGKTNQFNLTTRRHHHDDVERLTSLPGSVGLTLRLVDKFGDQGIIGMLLAVPDGEGGALVVDSFLVSCRGLSRGVEEVLWAELLNQASAAGVGRIRGHYIETAKNGLVAKLYDRLGLKRTKESGEGAEYVLEPVRPIAFPPWIVVNRDAL